MRSTDRRERSGLRAENLNATDSSQRESCLLAVTVTLDCDKMERNSLYDVTEVAIRTLKPCNQAVPVCVYSYSWLLELLLSFVSLLKYSCSLA